MQQPIALNRSGTIGHQMNALTLSCIDVNQIELEQLDHTSTRQQFGIQKTLFR